MIPNHSLSELDYSVDFTVHSKNCLLFSEDLLELYAKTIEISMTKKGSKRCRGIAKQEENGRSSEVQLKKYVKFCCVMGSSVGERDIALISDGYLSTVHTK